MPPSVVLLPRFAAGPHRPSFLRPLFLVLVIAGLTPARVLHEARWQPVTHARVDQPEVTCERYGAGDVVYFALVNLGTEAVYCTMQVNMAALGLAPGDGISSTYSEVARGAPLAVQTAGDTGHIRLRLVPDEAHIVKLVRTW